MSNWDMNVQRIIDLVEKNLQGELTLKMISRRLGYSPWYCTRNFSRIVGMSLRTYARLRRLSEAARALREKHLGILPVALEYGFGSQEAFTRAFKTTWGITPAVYRESPMLLKLIMRRQALLPSSQGENMNSKNGTEKVTLSIQFVPGRKFLGIKAPGATDYMDFWEKIKNSGQNCYDVEGILASLTSNAQIGGWYQDGAENGYLYGVEMSEDFQGTIPEGMSLTSIPGSEYLVFHYPPYDFETEDPRVWEALSKAVKEKVKAPDGYMWNNEIPMWQRHDPENMGQAWCRAITPEKSKK